MLLAGAKALTGDDDDLLPLSARLPLVTIVGVYYCNLVVNGFATKQDYFEFLSAACDVACATMNENLAILSRLVKYKSLSEEEADKCRNLMAELGKWARICTEPMSLGHISLFARMHWVQTHTILTASNSVPLQRFLYLCEKRRLEALKPRGVVAGAAATTTTDDEYEYERLMGALLEDSRVTPFLLQDRWPTTVRQCVQALQQWCCLPSMDGETVVNMIQRMELVERSNAVRQQVLLGEQIPTESFNGCRRGRGRTMTPSGATSPGRRARRTA